MRELPVTLALSLLVHAAALTWYVAFDHSEPSRPVSAKTSKVEVVEPVEDPPVEVTLLVDDTVTQRPDSDPVLVAALAKVTPREKTRTTAIAATTTTTTELAPSEPTKSTETPPVKKPSMLSMRDGRTKEPTIHRPGSDGISDEALKKMVDGGIDVKISNLPGAKENARYDKSQARLHNQGWVQNATPDELTQARFDREAARQAKNDVELVPQKDGTHTSDKTTFKAKVNRDGTVDFKDKPNLQQKGLGLEFDVTDAFMRNHGQDPYASEKLKYLDRTRDQRVEIGKRYRTEQLGQSAKYMAQNLGRLWAMTTDPATRKDELFSLWDECAETGDEEIVFGGARARELLINWVHAKHVVFTPAELTAFNAKRKSKATFAP